MADNMITNESGTVHTIKVKFGLCGPKGPKGENGAYHFRGLLHRFHYGNNRWLNGQHS